MLIISDTDPAILWTLAPLNFIACTVKAFMIVLIWSWVTIRFMIQISDICQENVHRSSQKPVFKRSQDCAVLDAFMETTF